MELLHAESDGRAPKHSRLLHPLTYQTEGSGSSLRQLYKKLNVCSLPIVSLITKVKNPVYKKMITRHYANTTERGLTCECGKFQR